VCPPNPGISTYVHLRRSESVLTSLLVTVISILPLSLTAFGVMYLQFHKGPSGNVPVIAKPSFLAGNDSGVQRISCRTVDGIPTTVSESDGKTIPLIRWISNEMAASGYGTEKRCEIVSSKFESYRSQGTLQYITTGRENNLPVICVATAKGGPCIGTLYTLKKGQDPVRTLQKLFHLRRGASGPISESGGEGRLYISFDELISAP
jgi:hypothetical protein